MGIAPKYRPEGWQLRRQSQQFFFVVFLVRLILQNQPVLRNNPLPQKHPRVRVSGRMEWYFSRPSLTTNCPEQHVAFRSRYPPSSLTRARPRPVKTVIEVVGRALSKKGQCVGLHSQTIDGWSNLNLSESRWPVLRRVKGVVKSRGKRPSAAGAYAGFNQSEQFLA